MMTDQSLPLILLVDDAEADRDAIRRPLSTQYRFLTVSSIETAIQVLESTKKVNLLLTNQQLPDGTGLQMLDAAAGYWPPIPVIIMVNPGNEAIAATAIKQGAADYVIKGETEALRLSQILSNALARATAELTSRQRAREMGALNVILVALNRELDEQHVLNAIVQEVQALMGSDACSIFLVDEDNDQMRLRASTRLPVDQRGWVIPIKKSIAGRVVGERQGCITHDVSRDPDWYSLDVNDLIPAPVRSMITVPMLIEDKAIGVLQVINKSVGPFLPTDLALMEAIAAVATAAITRGQQFAQIQTALQAQDKPE